MPAGCPFHYCLYWEMVLVALVDIVYVMWQLGVALVLATTLVVSTTYGSVQTMDLIIYPDGLVHVSTTLKTDRLDPVFRLELFGTEIDNFVAIGEGNILLSAMFQGEVAILDTFDSTTFTAEYDIHDLVTKEGRIWTFTLDTPNEFTLMMPNRAVIVGMNTIPSGVDIIGDSTHLSFSGGAVEVNYILNLAQSGAGLGVDRGLVQDAEDNILWAILVVMPAVAGAVAAVVVVWRRRQVAPPTKPPKIEPNTVQEVSQHKIPTPEAIFSRVADMREDDKEVVRYIVDNGGAVLESRLRKRFMQPRTTMWRTVKRLERMGVVEVSKRDAQNLVVIRSNPEDTA